MTDCESIEAQLLDLVEGTLSPGERDVLERHLAGCVPCRTALEETQALRAAYAALPEADVGPELETSLLDAAREAVADDRPSAAQRSPILGWPLATAAALILGWALAVVFHDPPPPTGDGDSVAAWLDRGQVLEQSGDLAAAEQLYRRALAERDEDVGVVRHRLGSVLVASGRYEEAVAILSPLVDGPPVSVERDAALVQLGRALAALGRLDEALSSYRLVAEGSPAHQREAEREIEALESRLLMERRQALESLGYIR